jgi:hypothetical protein
MTDSPTAKVHYGGRVTSPRFLQGVGRPPSRCGPQKLFPGPKKEFPFLLHPFLAHTKAQ